VEAGARRFLVPLLLEEFERFPDLVVKVAAVISSSFVRENPRARRVSTVSG
jgi:hypothetical protein